MKISHYASLALLLLALALQRVQAQGSLTPPGPPGPTMKSLAQIEPRIPISSLPFSISAAGSYYLTTNLLAGAGAFGISIDSNDVTLDLGGFALTGAGSAQTGILVANPHGNIVIRNGTVNRWGAGVDARVATTSTFEQIRVNENTGSGLISGAISTVQASSFSGNGGNGVNVGPGSLLKDCIASINSSNGVVVTASSVIAGCVAVNNSHTGFAGGGDTQVINSKGSNNGENGFALGPQCALTGCTASGNLAAGIAAGNETQVIDCKTVSNSRGISVNAGSTVRGCTSSQNGGDGILVTSDCVVVGNTSSSNFLARDASGIHASGSKNTIRENSVVSNDWGIRVEVAGNLIIKNTASNNSLNFFITGSPQMFGPVVTTTIPETSNPTANFEL